jgi:hypothetical protein
MPSRRAQRRQRQNVDQLQVPVPAGHSWSCPSCQATVEIVQTSQGREIRIGHDDDCQAWADRVRRQLPGLDLDPVRTLVARPVHDLDDDLAAGLFPCW